LTSLVDAHVHLYEFNRKEIEDFISSNMLLVAVAEDYDSSIRNLELRDEFPENVRACVGLHPWNVKQEADALRQLEQINGLLKEADCVGEVGLDLKFTPTTFNLQKQVFQAILDMAVSHSLPLNLHAAGAWSQVFEMLVQRGAKKAIFHWYTGPISLLQEITEKGFYISINASASIQEKSKNIARNTPLHLLLTESDGPYAYRGLNLSPLLIPELVKLISNLKRIEEGKLTQEIHKNITTLFQKH